MGKSLLEYLANSKHAKLTLNILEQNGEVSVDCKPEDLPEFLRKVKDDKNLAFTQLVGICGVDYPQQENA
jgi:NADH:ubiquinone oxidoreductase subunit C